MRVVLGSVSALVLVMSLVASGNGAPDTATEPSAAQPTPTPAPNVTPGRGGSVPGVLKWEPVGPPWLHADRRLRFPTAWSGGFALLEESPDDDEGAEPLAVWRSPDGRTWTRARLPSRVEAVRDLLPLGDGLLLVTSEEREWNGYGFALGFWRSPDGERWRRAGDLSYRVPDRMARERCQANRQQVTTIGDRIIVYVSMCWDPCCGAIPIGSGSERTLGLATRIKGPVEARGVAAWASRDGRRWKRQALKGMAPSGSGIFGVDIRQRPDELLAMRLDGDAVLRSHDGVTWTTFGQTPPGLDLYGGLELAAVSDSLLLLSESDDSPPGDGNEMIGWRMTPTDTSRVMQRRAGWPAWVVVDGDHVLVGGASWDSGASEDESDDDRYWVWLMGSADGGITWPEGLSWMGGVDSCLGDAAERHGTIVALACLGEPGNEPAAPALWLASMDDFPAIAP